MAWAWRAVERQGSSGEVFAFVENVVDLAETDPIFVMEVEGRECWRLLTGC